METRNCRSIALVVACGLFALAAVLMSGTGCERFTLIFAAVPLSLMTALVGFIIAARHGLLSRVCIAPLISLGIVVSVAITQWPLRFAFAVSRQAFEQIAVRLRAGERVGPQRVGLFSIRATEVYTSKDIICLWSDLEGRAGFVRCQPDEVPFDFLSIISLDGGWQFIYED